MKIEDQLFSVSVEHLRICTEDFTAGRITRDALDQAQAGYYSALTSANTARGNYLMARVELVTVTDRDPVVQQLSERRTLP